MWCRAILSVYVHEGNQETADNFVSTGNFFAFFMADSVFAQSARVVSEKGAL